MTNLIIESGIPIPPRSKWVAVLQKMKIDDSFTCTRSESSAAYSAAKAHGMDVIIRQEAPNKIRVWRIA